MSDADTVIEAMTLTQEQIAELRLLCERLHADKVPGSVFSISPDDSTDVIECYEIKGRQTSGWRASCDTADIAQALVFCLNHLAALLSVAADERAVLAAAPSLTGGDDA